MSQAKLEIDKNKLSADVLQTVFPNYFLINMKYGDEIVGSVQLLINVSHGRCDKSGNVCNLRVYDNKNGVNYQKHGIGTSLLSKAESFAREKGMVKMILKLEKQGPVDYKKLADFYIRRGYEFIEDTEMMIKELVEKQAVT